MFLRKSCAQPLDKVSDLLGDELVIAAPIQPTAAVFRALGNTMRQRVMSHRLVQQCRERIGDAKAVLAAHHERRHASQVGFKRQREQLEHGAIILARRLGRFDVQLHAAGVDLF